ncbi:uncharacterized protein LOC143150656 [Ptiloglossa arizonensis]|uniref:uncharacterized protein LOC143150656 n=1 Tax=Ptiloglossa arizonensis TaxID=3350558 RepID=UPI003FA0A1A4
MRSARSRDVSIVWTCFLMKTVGLWLAADRVEQRRRNFALIYTISAIFIATCIAIRDFYYSWGNFNVSVPESPLSKEFEVYSSDLELLLQDYRVQIPVAAFTMLSNTWRSLQFVEEKYVVLKNLSVFLKTRDCVYIGCNILYLMIVLFKIAILYIHKMEFFDLVLFTQKNFWHSDYDSQEKLILADCKKLCAIFIVVLSFCTQGTCAGYMATPLLANIGKNESERILPFNMWVDFPTGKSPYFEVLFIIQILCVYHVGVCYICFDNFLCLVNLHVASQFRVLQHRLINLNNNVKDRMHNRCPDESLSSYAHTSYQKLRKCVRQHQALTEYCRLLENIFAMMILGQVLFLAMIICLVGYQIFLADTPPSRSVSLTLNMAGTLCQLFMFTYSCDGLIQQSGNIGNATYSGPWNVFPMDKIGKSLRSNAIIIIMRSSRSCCLTASGFFPVSLETYTGVLSTAMSYFTLLRQSTLDMENT